MNALHRILVITGMSGSGKSTAARALEDAGWWCIDNLPAALLPKVAALGVGQDFLAFVVDVREGVYLEAAPAALAELRAAGHRVDVLFLDATDEALTRRYSETRRRHPLSANDGINKGIAKERAALAALREQAQHIIDTSALNVHELRRVCTERFATERSDGMALTLVSFGFKYGIPSNADLLFDARFLPNPFFNPDLRTLSGREQRVADFVLDRPETQAFLDRIFAFLEAMVPLYRREGKTYLTIAFGCTGGRHRSVAIVHALQERMRRTSWGEACQTWDRDLEKAEEQDARMR